VIAEALPGWAMVAVMIAGLIVIQFFFYVIYVKHYKRVGPNEVLIVSGRPQRLADGRTVGFRIVPAGGTFVWPVLEQPERVSLEVRELNLGPAGRAQVKICRDPASVAAWAEHFLSKKPEEVVRLVAETLMARLRSGGTESDLSSELARMGMELVSFTPKGQV
jgi:flotillin